MTTLTLTIGGTNFLPQYKTNSAKITEQLQNRGNTMSLEIIVTPGDSVPTEGEEIIFKDGSRYLFGGFVSRIKKQETGEGQLFVYDVEATDYTYVVINKNAQRTYEDQTLQYIVEDLVDTYIDAGYGITYTNVEVGPTINTIAFNHITLRKAFEKLAAVTGYEWWIDYEKDIHFQAKDSEPAPEDITDSTGNMIDINLSVDTSQLRNSVVVKGGKEETSSFFQQTIVADGEAREWLLREKPTEMEYIKLDTVSKTFGVDPLQDDTSYYFMFNFQEKYIRCSAATTTPTAGQEIEASYKYDVPVIVKLRSASSILAMAAIEGGDGLHEFTITDTSIKSKAEARERALKEILEYGNPIVNGYFTTRTGLLQAGSYFKPGQEVTLNLPTWGISTDTEYLIQEVITTMYETGSSIEYNYRVRFGGRLLNATSFLESIAGREQVILDTEEIDRIEVVAEDIVISEVITRDGNLVSVSESLSIAESISEDIVTPPFQYGPGGSPQGVWNLSLIHI
jgi:hypothetical protein